MKRYLLILGAAGLTLCGCSSNPERGSNYNPNYDYRNTTVQPGTAPTTGPAPQAPIDNGAQPLQRVY